jgi:hypothetical protein
MIALAILTVFYGGLWAILEVGARYEKEANRDNED